MEFLKLTDYETGEPIRLDSTAVVSMMQLSSGTLSNGTVVGRRTRIEAGKTFFMVREELLEIEKLLEEMSCRPIKRGTWFSERR